jgi:hypothetical protein
VLKWLLIWAVPGAIVQFIGGPDRQIGILFATGLLIMNPKAGWTALVALAIRLMILKIYGKKDTEYHVRPSGWIHRWICLGILRDRYGKGAIGSQEVTPDDRLPDQVSYKKCLWQGLKALPCFHKQALYSRGGGLYGEREMPDWIDSGSVFYG